MLISPDGLAVIPGVYPARENPTPRSEEPLLDRIALSRAKRRTHPQPCSGRLSVALFPSLTLPLSPFFRGRRCRRIFSRSDELLQPRLHPPPQIEGGAPEAPRKGGGVRNRFQIRKRKRDGREPTRRDSNIFATVPPLFIRPRELLVVRNDGDRTIREGKIGAPINGEGEPDPFGGAVLSRTLGRGV